MNNTVQHEPGKKLEWARGLGALLGLAIVLGLGALFAVVAEDVWLKETIAGMRSSRWPSVQFAIAGPHYGSCYPGR